MKTLSTPIIYDPAYSLILGSPVAALWLTRVLTIAQLRNGAPFRYGWKDWLSELAVGGTALKLAIEPMIIRTVDAVAANHRKSNPVLTTLTRANPDSPELVVIWTVGKSTMWWVDTEKWQHLVNLNAGRQTIAPRTKNGKAPNSKALEPHTPPQHLLFEILAIEYEAKERRKPKKFQSLEAMKRYNEVSAILGDELEPMIREALAKGILSISQITSWLAGCGKNKRKRDGSRNIDLLDQYEAT